MVIKKLNIIITCELALFLLLSFVGKISFAENNCPSRTTAGTNYIIFVGKVTSMGNDQKVKAWFEYGENANNLKSTRKLALNKEGIYCLKVANLKSCQNYFYRAGVSNQAGKTYGELKEVKTLCLNNSKLKIDNFRKNYNNLINLTFKDSYQIQKCSPSDINFNLINNTSLKRKVIVEVEGETKPWFEPQQREFNLNPEEKLDVNWKVYPPCQISDDKYLVTFKLTTSGFTKNYQTALEVKSQEVENPLSAFASLIFNNFPWFLVFILIITCLILFFMLLKSSKKENVNFNSRVIK